MQLAMRDLPALVTARREGTTLASEQKKSEVTPATPAGGPDIATALEALRAVLPATLITLYTTGVLLLQNLTNAAGAAGRAADQAALASTYGAGTPELAKALEALSVEPMTFAWARVVFAVACTFLVAFYAYRTAQVVPEKKVLIEPTVVTLAFVAWAVASPGTFLAAYLNTNNLAVTTILVAFIAAIGLFVIANTVLKKKEVS